MRFIVLKSFVTEKGDLGFRGLSSLTQKPSGTVDGWIDLSEAKTNCLEPEKCDLLSFEDRDQLESDLEIWGIDGENVTIIGVEAGE